jgi:hypothetical protein
VNLDTRLPAAKVDSRRPAAWERSWRLLLEREGRDCEHAAKRCNRNASAQVRPTPGDKRAQNIFIASLRAYG